MRAKIDWRHLQVGEQAVELVSGRIERPPVRQPDPDVVAMSEIAFDAFAVDAVEIEKARQRPAHLGAHPRAATVSHDAFAHPRGDLDKIGVRHTNAFR